MKPKAKLGYTFPTNKRFPQWMRIDRILDDLDPLIEGTIEGAERTRDIVDGLKRFSAVDRDEHQRFVVGGVEQVPRGLWRLSPDRMVHWPKGTTLERLHDGAPRPGVTRIERAYGDKIAVSDQASDVTVGAHIGLDRSRSSCSGH